MKKLMGLILLLSTCLIQLNQVEAATSTDTKTATFDLINNPNGTILVEAADLSFGQHELSSTDINAKTNVNSSIKITEFSGTQPGWTLKVQLDQFQDADQNKINGLRLFYPKVTPVTTTGGNASVDTPTTLGTQTSFVDSLQGTIVNDDNVPVKIAGADLGKGYGNWELPYNDTNRIQLNIPTGDKIGAYSSVLTYTIEDSP